MILPLTRRVSADSAARAGEPDAINHTATAAAATPDCGDTAAARACLRFISLSSAPALIHPALLPGCPWPGVSPSYCKRRQEANPAQNLAKIRTSRPAARGRRTFADNTRGTGGLNVLETYAWGACRRLACAARFGAELSCETGARIRAREPGRRLRGHRGHGAARKIARGRPHDHDDLRYFRVESAHVQGSAL